MNRDADHKSDSGWQECPPGEVSQLVGRLRARRQRQTLRQVALGVAGLCLVLIAGNSLVHRVLSPAGPNFGGITCSEVTRNAEAYVAGNLDAELVRRIDSHLDSCLYCRSIIERMQEQGESAPVARQETAPLASPVLITLTD